MRIARKLAVLAAFAWAAAAPAAPTGKRINLELVRADLHQVLRILAEAGRVNVIVPDEVQGTVTLRLRDVPWDEALDAVLSLHALGYERRGNVLRIAPLKQLAEEADQRARLKRDREGAAPLVTTLIPVSYARAADLLPHVKALLSPRGSASVDARTNSIIVRDVDDSAAASLR